MDNRKLDALIQEALFPWDEAYCRGCGWRRIDVDGTPPDNAVGCAADSCSQHPLRTPPADSPAPWSTDPAASKQLRDKMREDGWIVLMGGPEAKVPKFWCQVRATYRKNTKGIFHRESDTEELAVALAALAAVGRPIEWNYQEKRNP